MIVPAKKEMTESLLRTFRELAPEADFEKLFEEVIRSSTRILGADRTLLFLYEEDGEPLVLKYRVHVEGCIAKDACDYDTDLLERASRGEIIMTSDPPKDNGLGSLTSMQARNIRTVFCAPLLAACKVHGVICTEARGKRISLDEERRVYFLSFVDFISDVIADVQRAKEKEKWLPNLPKGVPKGQAFPEIMGRSHSMELVLEKIRKITSVSYPLSVLIVGESGTGKDLIARAIHQLGRRSGKCFVVVNCAALPATLIESELFGHEKGAFTGAIMRRRGFFEVANGGIIFLDEIGELPLELQPKLLRVLQFRTFNRIGGREELKTDIQILSATSKDLYREMEDGKFRRDLFHRLASYVVYVPPLRERQDDILFLAHQFMESYSREMGRPLRGIDAAAQSLLMNYDFRRNNVRELKNLIERAVFNSEGDKIKTCDILFSDDLIPSSSFRTPEVDSPNDSGILRVDERLFTKLLEVSAKRKDAPKREKPYYQIRREMEKKLILLSLRHTSWKVKTAARLLGINQLNLRQKLSSLQKEILAETNDDILEISLRYNAPASFMNAQLRFADESAKCNINQSEDIIK